MDGVDAVSLSSFHKPSAACVCLTIRAYDTDFDMNTKAPTRRWLTAHAGNNTLGR